MNTSAKGTKRLLENASKVLYYELPIKTLTRNRRGLCFERSMQDPTCAEFDFEAFQGTYSAENDD